MMICPHMHPLLVLQGSPPQPPCHARSGQVGQGGSDHAGQGGSTAGGGGGSTSGGGGAALLQDVHPLPPPRW